MRRPPHKSAPRYLSDRSLFYFLLLPPLPCQAEYGQQNHAYSGVNRAASFPHPAASLFLGRGRGKILWMREDGGVGTVPIWTALPPW